MAKPPAPPRTIQCYHCRHRFEVPSQALSATCPKCSKPLNLEDLVVKVAYSVRKIQTCGKILVQKKGRLIAQSVEAQGGVEVEGVLEANVVSGGPVRIRAKAQWKGDCAAPALEVELGGQIERGYFVIPHDALGVADMHSRPLTAAATPAAGVAS